MAKTETQVTHLLPQREMTLESVARTLGIWTSLARDVRARLAADRFSTQKSVDLFEALATIPIRPSRATTRLGSYVANGRKPLCIRLQFAQSEAELRATLLHEVAHACDHLTQSALGRICRRKRFDHGPSWRAWAMALGVEPSYRGASETVSALHQRRIKVVAACTRCGEEIRRVRRLPRGVRYLHLRCGGVLAAR